MNIFDKKLNTLGCYPLKAEYVSTLQINLCYKCNLTCAHCHVEASPKRPEQMSQATVNRIIDILKNHDEITTVDLTGGAPEYNAHFKHLVKTATDLNRKVIVRTNLAIYAEPGMRDIPEFLAANKVKIVASLPCYTAEGVDGQRGKGT